ncbi:pimeloyl-ACP methyl ester carboxylesterase [Chitinophaga sp. W3I9]|uniref:alpha/beta fold hydrolase n=1 Tax=Chitinophaga sp. W3I9 TaxID=3373924 RepID=UPI003D256B93
MQLMSHIPAPAEVFKFQGQEIRFGVLGTGAPLVLLHGTPFSSVVWRRIGSWLAEHRQVFYYDLPGYGYSEKKEGQDVSLGIQNKVFAALLQHWGLDRPDIVAHDFGGTTALRTHLLDGRDYRSLTLIDPVAIGPSGSPFVQAAKNHPEVFTGLPAYIHEAILRAYISGAAFHPLPEDVMQLYLRPWLGETGQAAFYRQIAQMSDQYTNEIENHFSEIRCPVTILWGEDDQWIPLERGKELSRRIGNARLHVVPQAKHLVQEDAPEAIIATVLGFLSTAG